MNFIFIFILSFSLLLIFWSYIGYPISLMILAPILGKKILSDESYCPSVSVLISAYNEERDIKKTILRLLDSDYDLDKLEIIVGLDFSSDSTNTIVEALAKDYKQVKPVVYSQRTGKARIINDIAKIASGEVLVFCDANTMYHKDAIKRMVEPFGDKSVGGVCGRLLLKKIDTAISSGSKELNYWNYETVVKSFEGKLGILIGSNGGIYSVRKEYFVPPLFEPVTQDDLFTTMKVLEQKKKFLYVKDAVAEEDMTLTAEAEYRRKARITSVNISTIKPLVKLLSPAYGLVSYGFWFHKIVRWFSPILFILALISNAAVMNYSAVCYYAFLLQALFYIAALSGGLLKMLGIRIQPFLLCTYFVMVNFALLQGIYHFFTKPKTSFWESTARK